MWAGRAQAYASSFAGVCAHPVPRLLDAARVGAGVRVLDVGTGTGTVAEAACARGAGVTGVDAEADMVEWAARAVPSAATHLAVLPQLPFSEGLFDAVTANFVLDHVGRPRAAITELRRVVRPGGRIAVTLWAVPEAAGQTLLGRAVRDAAVRDAGLPVPSRSAGPAAEDDFPRTETGLAELLTSAGLRDVACEPVRWEHRVPADAWWAGAVAGLGTVGQIVASRPERTRADIRRHFDLLSTEFAIGGGELALPHAALLAWGRR
ncbi:class I SAM-dependent methyltransferase [Streptomyces sp. ASQP_92]|uniref:class I SAM-dependent methyltransferase n=1 Tax=Streptomyces sp. ASQP_92 TaxID=2979116 RepID=UPI0021BE55E6|nr:class I SAM-dependent methyltransferase [Streptomyces sp. ASQP_92]MCT9088837.1 class I SAM-dependent methyltransferase [Streptomyces sp. ASQP_92]